MPWFAWEILCLGDDGPFMQPYFEPVFILPAAEFKDYQG